MWRIVTTVKQIIGVLPYGWKKVLENITRGDGNPEEKYCIFFRGAEGSEEENSIFFQGITITPSDIFQYFFSAIG